MNTIGDLPGMQRASRSEIVDRVFDVVVIGGGITGAATARDAALRGLSVLLVEKDDFASGTSSRSSKLIHGGLRYLQTYQFRMVAESLRERERMLRIAPHLTRVRPFLYLLYQGYPESKALLNLGLTYYDVASGAWRRRRHRMLDAAQVLALEPHLAAEGLIGAGLYHDVLTDDARVTLDTVHGAADAGARVMNHARVVDLLREAGRIAGVRIRDELTGETFDAVGRQVLNATGPWTETVRAMETGSGASRLRPTKGVHIVVRKTDFPLGTAVFLRSPRDGRVVWPTPSLEEDLVYIGTTDTDYTGPLDDVVPTQEDVEYLIEVANVAIPAARLDLSHVVGSWAGLRPLVAPAPGVSADKTSREHEISTGPGGMLTISGGKLTTSRLMAKQLVDAAAHALRPRRGAGASVRSTTTQVPIAGGELATAR
ncbi:MAG: glycerol-3-phosphate dehydrogenase/oxidase, partial [Actinomycetales bacterium]|nr:glycerol-3-phosphate dehydrogenase/oxidase [Actinomycetales bacterium]